MKYSYKEYTYLYDYNEGLLYRNKHLIFKGNGWSGIQFFLAQTGNAPEVREMFKTQLEQREKPKYTNPRKMQKDDTCFLTCCYIDRRNPKHNNHDLEV